MKRTERLVYTNAEGESITMGFYTNYVVTDFAESVDNDIVTTKNAGQDGESYISDALKPRPITIKGFFQLSADSNRLERMLKHIFNPKISGVLNFKALDSDRYIDVKVESMPTIVKKLNRGEFTIELIAYMPYWCDKEQVEYLALLTPEFKFPLVIPQNKGIVFGRRRSILETEIQNRGDAESGFTVVFKAKGSVKNPCIVNKVTGEIIKIIYDMEKGDVIKVVNEVNKKQVFVNEQKAFKHLDRLNSIFFTLDVGKNVVAYSADENIVNLDVIVYFTPLFM